MKVIAKYSRTFLLLVMCSVLFSFNANKESSHVTFPWKKAGLTERQAAAHLLSRFTFGARPGDVDLLINMGLEKWFEQQLQGNLPNTDLDTRLRDYDALNLTNTQVAAQYPRTFQVLKMAQEDGYVSKDTLEKENKEKYKAILQAYLDKKGFKPLKELQRQFANQKILRAAYSNNQLVEVLTDFWFNHFNVSVTKNDCAQYIPAYERDVIRPNVFAKFEDLLIATTKSPAMLFYLDNFSSSGTNTDFNIDEKTRLQRRMADRPSNGSDSAMVNVLDKMKQRKTGQGLNENYAREVMELHTLGVDGGYSQQDVTNAARVLTGWTVYPFSDYGPAKQIRKIIDRIGEDKLVEKGFVHEGDFLFAANRHDNGEKIVLGKTLHNANGYQEGVALLNILSHHPSTAAFMAHKLAVRFVSDNPPTSLTDKMAKTFLAKDGDTKEVLLTMVSSPEFWDTNAIRQKTKSPFELAISAVRSLNADIVRPYALYNAISKMGQKLYAYQAPTGYPDRGQYWINTGALLNRMNFGLAIATQRNQGVRVDLLALNDNHEPESAEAALSTYSNILLPERNLTETVKRLTPLLNDPGLEMKITKAADKTPATQTSMTSTMQPTEFETTNDDSMQSRKKTPDIIAANSAIGKNMLSQVVGIIIGSPEFQRR